MSNQYTCAWCHETYELVSNEEWNDEKAHAEAKQYFGVDGTHHDMVRICDDCFQLLHPAKHPDKVAEARRRLSE